MTKKQLTYLLSQTYKNGELDQEAVLAISQALRRSALKQYLNALKKEEQKKQVVITSPFVLSEKLKQRLQEAYSSKRLIYRIDKTLLLGIRVEEYDRIITYDLNDMLLQSKERMQSI